MMAQNTVLTGSSRQSERVGFAAIALEQIDKISEFGKGLTAYWLRCWRIDCFGNVFVPLQEDIGNTTKAKYRKILQQLGFFMFEVRQFGKQRTLWVRNLCAPKSDSFRYPVAYKQASFWGESSPQNVAPQSVEKSLDKIEQTLETKMPLLEDNEQKKLESISTQEFQQASVSTLDNLNTTQQQELVVGEENLEDRLLAAHALVVQNPARVDNQELPFLKEDKNLEVDHYLAAAIDDVGRTERSHSVIEDDLNEEELEDRKAQAKLERQERATIKSRLKNAGVELNAQVIEAIGKLSTKSLDLLLDELLHRIRHGKKLDNVTGYFRSMIDDGWVLKEKEIKKQKAMFTDWYNKAYKEGQVIASMVRDGVQGVITPDNRWIPWTEYLRV